MKKIYLRAGISPMDHFDVPYVLINNSIGNNVGNLIYAYSMFRTLTQNDVEVVPNYYSIDPSDADRINETYDYFVIPLADAFRTSFVGEMKKMTRLIRRLKIPCIISGVGLRADFDTKSDFHFPFDNDVKKFIHAVLDKSSIVGVRGEITSAYLKSLGFREEIDHTVIGCPSMYTFGEHLTLKKVHLTKQSKISVNGSVMSPSIVQGFLNRTMKKIPDHYFLPQRIQELSLIYTGFPYQHKQKCKGYPSQISAKVYKEDRVKFFLNAPQWLDFLKTVDLSVGARMHGNIAALIAGTPAILIPHDARMKELTEYHQLPHIWANDITEHTDIFDLASKIDFQSVEIQQKKNFLHFIDFLNKNQLPHIYQNDIQRKDAPLDTIVNSLSLDGEVISIRHCTIDEMAKRWASYYPELDKNMIQLKQERNSLKQTINTLEQKLADQKASSSLKRKLIRFMSLKSTTP